MSAVVKLSSKLPGDEDTNGVDSLHDQLVDNPHQVICAIVWLDVPKVETNTETDDVVPTVRVRKIEPIGVADKVPAAVIDLYHQLVEARTGRKPLPFTQLDGRFEHVDTSGGHSPDLTVGVTAGQGEL